jgi:hypothetical protein
VRSGEAFKDAGLIEAAAVYRVETGQLQTLEERR